LGFLGGWLFCRESRRLSLLDSLGFPWILSSESRLINGLRGFFRERNFSHLFLGLRDAAGREPAVEAMRMRRILHEESLAEFLIFCNQLSPDGVLSLRDAIEVLGSKLNRFLRLASRFERIAGL
jgi:hypothetical protein